MLRHQLSPADAASAYWTLPVQDRTWREAAKRLGLPDHDSRAVQNFLSKLARDWEEAGGVAHVVRRDPGSLVARYERLSRVPELEHRLAQRERLRNVIVVDPAELALPTDAADDSSDASEGPTPLENRVHRALGLWGARILAAVVRTNDVVGVAGGRGCHYTADALSLFFRHPGTLRIGSVVALHGNTLLRDWSHWSADEVIDSMDPNSVSTLLSHILQPQAIARCPLSLFKNPSATPSPTTLADPWKVTRDSITVAVVGIGEVCSGHALMTPANPSREQCQDLADAHPRHIGEICGRMFSSVDDLHPILHTMNSQLNGTDFAVLQECCARGSVIAVAGGETKKHLVLEAIRLKPQSYDPTAKDLPIISHLVTDRSCAEHILSTPPEPLCST